MKVPVVAAIAMVLWSSAASACECRAFDDKSFPMERYGRIFSGTVLDVEATPVPARGGEASVKAVRLSPERTWRGAVPQPIRVYTGLGGADCGFKFEPGRRYLVFTESDSWIPGVQFVSRCGPTRPLEAAAGLLKRLN